MIRVYRDDDRASDSDWMHAAAAASSCLSARRAAAALEDRRRANDSTNLPGPRLAGPGPAAGAVVTLTLARRRRARADLAGPPKSRWPQRSGMMPVTT